LRDGYVNSDSGSFEARSHARISIVVPSFNQAQFIGATLDSLLAQDDPDLEIIVVDGGSTDGAVDVIRRYADRITSWVSEPDRGQSDALNKGFAKATGQWLGWLNSDDMLLPGTLASLRRNIEAQPDRQWWIGGGYFIDGQGKRLRDYGPPIGLERPEQLADWREFWFAQPSTFFSRSLFDRTGGLVREDLHYAMDLELWLRLLKQCGPGIIESPFSAYRIHEAAKTGALTVAAEMEIIQVISEALGNEAVFSRVRCIAADRLDFELKYRQLLGYAQPFIKARAMLKSAWRRVAPKK
jgi:glycosyltransferase involved in cell wall biosynthesis